MTFFNAASHSDNSMYSWFAKSRSINDTLRSELPTIRNRSRELTENDSWTSSGRRAYVVNIVGSRGFDLRPILTEEDFEQSNLRKYFNSPQEVSQFIIRQFSRWGKKAMVRGGSWHQAQKAAVEAMYTDGEIFCRHYIDPSLNEFGYAIDFFESEYVDVEARNTKSNVVNGIGFDKFNRPLFYVFYTAHPDEITFKSSSVRKQVEIPATDIIHLKNTSRPSQTRGLPAVTPVMPFLYHLHEYTKATVTGKHASAKKLGFIVPAKEDTDTPYEHAERDTHGQIVDYLRDVGFQLLPPGADVKSFNPTDTGSNIKEFVTVMGHIVAAGLGVDYHALTGDYESVSYSSIRQAGLNIKDVWTWRQDYLKETLIEPVFNKWLDISLLKGAFGPAFSDEDIQLIKDSTSFEGRGWGFTDPTKEANSHQTYVEMGARSISDVIRENNQNPDQVFKEIKEEREKLRELGIELSFTKNPNIPTLEETSKSE
ncbi:putative Phage portal protein [Candidatus Defluviicoccus seviourii]|uniref:Phage portal protein n=1 Tax=Candidatus Defluviicoccus seviourii TaxID=2565273 RepID=A0A564WHL9_9PROT|nr:putative Phage portal protein [Candidatus Defluviicoccus seviourii]